VKQRRISPSYKLPKQHKGNTMSDTEILVAVAVVAVIFAVKVWILTKI